MFRGATADFAPPEMLSDDIPGLAELRKSPAIDVYAAASVVYQLACGRLLTICMRLGKMGRLFRRIARRWPLPRRLR